MGRPPPTSAVDQTSREGTIDMTVPSRDPDDHALVGIALVREVYT